MATRCNTSGIGKARCGSLVLISLFLGQAAFAQRAIRIDQVEDKYALWDYSFEVNPRTGLAGIRLEYSYLAGRLGGDDSDRGPAPKIITVPGLSYDSDNRTIVYRDGTAQITCAVEAPHRVLLWKTMLLKPTGACIVSSHPSAVTKDTGWSLDRSGTVETFFTAENNR